MSLSSLPRLIKPPSHPLSHYIASTIPILDIRPTSSYKIAHAPKSCNIPWSELKDRMHEMPHGFAEVVLMGDNWDDLCNVRHYLLEECQKSDRRILDMFLIPDHVEEGDLSEDGAVYHRLWEPNVHIMADIEFIEEILTGAVPEDQRQDLKELKWKEMMQKLQQQEESEERSSSVQQEETDSSTQLYSPQTLDGIPINTAPGTVTNVTHPLINIGPSDISPPKRPDNLPIRKVTEISAIDLGCGCGRDCVWLAAERHWKCVTGMDNRSWRLLRMMDLARHMNTENSVATLCVNLKKGSLLEQHPELEGSLDVVYAVRFLHKPLLADLGRLLKPGGLVVYCQFYKGANPPSKDRDILQVDEMRSVFREWIVWRDEIRACEDGRPLQWFIAQKVV